jgi:large subunit ribosomal protein L25
LVKEEHPLKQLELTVMARETKGNGPARRLRREGLVPAVLYGPGAETKQLSIKVRDLEHVVQKGNIRRTIFSLGIQNGGSATKLAVIKELQTNPVTGQFLHVDFYEIDMNRKLRVMVPVALTGKAKGEEFGGMLQIIEREIAVFCLHVKNIVLPPGVELPPGENYTVVTVVSPKAEAAPAAAAPVEGEEAEGAETPAEGEGEAAAEKS